MDVIAVANSNNSDPFLSLFSWLLEHHYQVRFSSTAPAWTVPTSSHRAALAGSSKRAHMLEVTGIDSLSNQGQGVAPVLYIPAVRLWGMLGNLRQVNLRYFPSF